MIRTRQPGPTLWALLAWSALAGNVFAAQDAIESRTERWRQARLARVEVLEPPQRGALETVMYRFEDGRVLERFRQGLHGFRPKLGGLATGSGFALGTEFRNDAPADSIRLGVSAQASAAGYQLYEVHVGLPAISDGRLAVDLASRYRNYPQEDFFGLGPDSEIENRTSFRFEQAEVVATARYRLQESVTLGVSGGVLSAHSGSGTDERFPSIEDRFGAAEVPALDVQPDYMRWGAFLAVDYRDSSSNPRAGGYYHLEWTSFQDTTLERFDFQRVEVEVRQYIPFLNKRRVLAFRARTSMSATAPGQQLPFYMAPALGGSDDLRGFREFRFRDRNLLVMNLEYRWEAFSGLDLALFGDGGKVFSRRADLDFSGLEAAYGVGARFNSADGVFLRIDAGFSHEGRRIFFKFGHTF